MSRRNVHSQRGRQRPPGPLMRGSCRGHFARLLEAGRLAILLIGLPGTWWGCADAPVDPASSVPRAPVELSASVSRAEVAVAETFTYTVTLDREPEIPAVMPEIFSRIAGLQVTDIRKEAPVQRDGRHREQQIFSLQGLEAGSYILPALEVRWSDEQGQAQVAGVPQIFVEVKSNFKEGEELADIADIKPLEAPPLDTRRLALLGVGILVILALVAWAIGWSRRRRRRESPPPPPPPPWEVALQALDALAHGEALEAGDARAFGFALSETMRRYLEHRFQISALEASTEEILGRFPRSPVPQGRPRDQVRRILQETDRAKFARHPLVKAEALELIHAAREFVQVTLPPPPPEAGDGRSGEGILTSSSRQEDAP